MTRLFQVVGGAALLILLVGQTHGQTVQLPSYRWFSVNTAVLAPDRGAAYLGGVRRSTQGATRKGTPGLSRLPGLGRLAGNRGLGGSAGTSGTSVHVTVIDHSELDRAVLAEAKRRRGITGECSSVTLAGLSAQLTGGGSSAPDERLMSVAEIRRQNAQRRSLEQKDALRFAVQGKQAEEKGSLGAAKIFYQMALRRASGDLKSQVAARLDSLTRQEPPVGGAVERSVTR